MESDNGCNRHCAKSVDVRTVREDRSLSAHEMFFSSVELPKHAPGIPNGLHRGVQLSVTVSRALAFGERSKTDQVRKSYGSLFCVRLSEDGLESALRGSSPSPLDAAIFSKHAPRG
jgi:hypothetical protein